MTYRLSAILKRSASGFYEPGTERLCLFVLPTKTLHRVEKTSPHISNDPEH